MAHSSLLNFAHTGCQHPRIRRWSHRQRIAQDLRVRQLESWIPVPDVQTRPFVRLAQLQWWIPPLPRSALDSQMYYTSSSFCPEKVVLENQLLPLSWHGLYQQTLKQKLGSLTLIFAARPFPQCSKSKAKRFIHPMRAGLPSMSGTIFVS